LKGSIPLAKPENLIDQRLQLTKAKAVRHHIAATQKSSPSLLPSAELRSFILEWWTCNFTRTFAK
jgi:hypothetical protein